MCLLALAWRCRPDWPLLLAANRDEFHARPAEALGWWPEGFAAGRDLEAGGAWLGVGTDGRFAAVTNFRDPSASQVTGSSRGELVVDYLRGGLTAGAAATALAGRVDRYRAFNLLLGDADTLWYLGSRAGPARQLAAGVHAISNAVLDTPWPKVRRLRARFEAALVQCEPTGEMLQALSDRAFAADPELPSTGVPLEWERRLSAAFIVSPEYGTRCSTVLALAPRRGSVIERRYHSDGTRSGETRLDW